MYVDSILNSLITKHHGQWITGNFNSTIVAGSSAVLGIDVMDPWVTYLLTVSGYMSEQDVNVGLYDTNSNVMGSWTDFSDTNITIPIVPLFQSGIRLTGRRSIGPSGGKAVATFLFAFVNDSANLTDINIGWNGFLITRDNADAFEAEFKKLYLFGRTPEREVSGDDRPQYKRA